MSLAGSLRGDRALVKRAEPAVWLNFLLVTIASATLVGALLSRDFSILYVFEHSNRSLSSAYTVTAFWAGQEGSLLLWTWLLAGSTLMVVRRSRFSAQGMDQWATFVLLANSTFFLLALNFFSNPFTSFPGATPMDGLGLNPHLRDPGMIIHPPTLFIGYAGLTVPFAFALASFLSGREDSLWITKSRRWAVVSWFFLGVGILLGAQWAYVELGWGGYWAWDPVENASLMPWLTSTAFIHSIMIQKQRGVFRLWSVNLILITYFLIIFGTFITRSGIISSVHTFGKSDLGIFFLVYMIIILIAGLLLVLMNRKPLDPKGRMQSLSSREKGFLMGNLLFTVMAFSVFLGTIFPIVSEFVTGDKFLVGPSYYNRVNIPIALFLMVLMGICPHLSWEKTPGRNLVKDLSLPLALAAVGAGGSLAAGVDRIPSVLVFSFSAFLVGSVIVKFYKDAKISAGTSAETIPSVVTRLIMKNRRRYGAQVVHLGIAIVFLGLSGAPLSDETHSTIKPGESISVGEYNLTYRKMEWIPGNDQVALTTWLLATKGGKAIGWLIPEKRFYERRENEPTGEVSILGNWKEDLYIALTDYDHGGRASFRVLVNPFVPWLWAGGYIVGIGTLIILWPSKRTTGFKVRNELDS
jgi:cytochrome c-type biogenesis protein CcmF